MANILIVSSSFPYNIDTPVTILYAVDNKWTSLRTGVVSGWQDDADGYTHLPVDSIAGFYISGGYVSIDEEILYFSSVSYCATSGTLHIPTSSRALFNTTASAHDSSSKIEMRIVAEYHNRLTEGLINTQIFIGSSSVGAPTGQGGDEAWSSYSYLTSGTHKIYSGSLEQRVRFLEWAVTELFVSGTSGSYVANEMSGSVQLREAIWY